MLRLLRLVTGADGQSHVEEHELRTETVGHDLASAWMDASRVRFQESPPGSDLDWHVAPRRQFVVTLAGTLEFVTRNGQTFRVGPGDVLLAEDTVGGGHQWRLVDDQPWRRVYIEVPPEVDEQLTPG